MRTTGSVDEVRTLVNMARHQGRRVGCVPTMGALHAGHNSLIRIARDQCDQVIVTLFVNASQFNDSTDFQHYPRPLEDDLAICRELGVDLVFQPEDDTMDLPASETTVDVGRLGRILEGRHRPGHFRGVATVVVKLLNIVGPDVAFFGMKDYQQQLVIRHLCRELHLPVKITTCPTIRDDDGLALSSRNVLLTPDQRTAATSLYRVLRLVQDHLDQGATDLDQLRKLMRSELETNPEITVDYATIVDAQTLEEPSRVEGELVALVAAAVDDIRLIDNLPLTATTSPAS
ncbi:MAG: pantoate--beta-alanine ligase [Planctomycetaceae bacterium]